MTSERRLVGRGGGGGVQSFNVFDDPLRYREEQLKKQLAQERRQQEAKAQQLKEEGKKQEDLNRMKQEEDTRRKEEQEKLLQRQMDKEVRGHLTRHGVACMHWIESVESILFVFACLDLPPLGGAGLQSVKTKANVIRKTSRVYAFFSSSFFGWRGGGGGKRA